MFQTLDFHAESLVSHSPLHHVALRQLLGMLVGGVELRTHFLAIRGLQMQSVEALMVANYGVTVG